MTEDAEISKTILEVIADTESYPARLTQDDIRDSDAIKKSFENISTDVIVFHVKMLEEACLIEADFLDVSSLQSAEYHVTVIGLTKQGSDHVKYIRSSFWDKAKQDLESAGKPLTIQLIFGACEKLIQQF